MGSPVVKVESYRAAANLDQVSENSYAGMRIHALQGLHEFVVNNAIPFLPAGATVLDIGAGSGAMSARLSDVGFSVSAVDIVTSNFKLKDKVAFYEADLNADFADIIGKSFDGLFAIEVIEHLENPRHFLRQCHQLLRPGGHIVVSTPNIDNPVSTALFLRGGFFHWFADVNYVKDGHLTPLSQLQLQRIVAECKFSIEWQASFGNPFDYVKNWPRMRMLARLCNAISPIPKSMRGEVVTLILKKN